MKNNIFKNLRIITLAITVTIISNAFAITVSDFIYTDKGGQVMSSGDIEVNAFTATQNAIFNGNGATFERNIFGKDNGTTTTTDDLNFASSSLLGTNLDISGNLNITNGSLYLKYIKPHYQPNVPAKLCTNSFGNFDNCDSESISGTITLSNTIITDNGWPIYAPTCQHTHSGTATWTSTNAHQCTSSQMNTNDSSSGSAPFSYTHDCVFWGADPIVVTMSCTNLISGQSANISN